MTVKIPDAVAVPEVPELAKPVPNAKRWVGDCLPVTNVTRAGVQQFRRESYIGQFEEREPSALSLLLGCGTAASRLTHSANNSH